MLRLILFPWFLSTRVQISNYWYTSSLKNSWFFNGTGYCLAQMGVVSSVTDCHRFPFQLPHLPRRKCHAPSVPEEILDCCSVVRSVHHCAIWSIYLTRLRASKQIFPHRSLWHCYCELMAACSGKISVALCILGSSRHKEAWKLASSKIWCNCEHSCPGKGVT